MDIKLELENHSNDENNSEVVIFQKDTPSSETSENRMSQEESSDSNDKVGNILVIKDDGGIKK